MFILKITDTQAGTTEQATVKGPRILEGHYTPERKDPYSPSIAMADTIDLLWQLKSPKVIMELFQEASTPRWTLALQHI